MDKRILSIQSHVVRGYVGNKSATFPLQVLGYEVDAINSVQFSNHTQYAAVKGQILESKELSQLVDGLRQNNLLHRYTHLLTGYIGNPSFLRQTVEVAKELKSLNPSLKYVCDPVMGDNGRFYVTEEVLPIYQQEVLAVADVVTPNQFEIEKLTGMQISTVEDAVKAMKIIHEKGPKTVIISSSDFRDDGHLVMFASDRKEDGSYEVIQQKIPHIGAVFVGTGDLFAALLLAWLEKDGLPSACKKVISTMQNVLQRTLKAAQAEVGEGNKPGAKELELRLIQSIRDIENPTCNVPECEVLNV